LRLPPGTLLLQITAFVLQSQLPPRRTVLPTLADSVAFGDDVPPSS